MSLGLVSAPKKAHASGPANLPVNGDSDGDMIHDSRDNCPNAWNFDQRDSGGIGTTLADGIGDVCQCGDVTDNGLIEINDATIIKRALLGLGPGMAQRLKCNVFGVVFGVTERTDADEDGTPDDCRINDAPRGRPRRGSLERICLPIAFPL